MGELNSIVRSKVKDWLSRGKLFDSCDILTGDISAPADRPSAPQFSYKVVNPTDARVLINFKFIVDTTFKNNGNAELLINGHATMHEIGGNFGNAVNGIIEFNELNVLLHANNPIELRVWGGGNVDFVFVVGDIA